MVAWSSWRIWAAVRSFMGRRREIPLAMQRNSRCFIVPGLGNSGPDHWQTYLERRNPSFVRIQQREWNAPDRAEWVATIEQALAGEDLSQVVLVAHSLGCAAVAHWAMQHGRAIRAALLVAPADVEAAHFVGVPATGFAPMPQQRLPFASKVVASTTDEWVTPARAAQFAAAWGSQLV
ncbi:MAG: alpha/beta fold hydrolase, partial [Hymenobacter sp.]